MASSDSSYISSIIQQIQQNHCETKNEIQSLKHELSAIIYNQFPSNINQNQQNKVVEWLNKISLSQYSSNFISNGYDDMDIILDMNKDDLIQIGFNKPGHLKKILILLNQSIIIPTVIIITNCNLIINHNLLNLDQFMTIINISKL